jgi:hypothetical protein
MQTLSWATFFIDARCDLSPTRRPSTPNALPSHPRGPALCCLPNARPCPLLHLSSSHPSLDPRAALRSTRCCTRCSLPPRALHPLLSPSTYTPLPTHTVHSLIICAACSSFVCSLVCCSFVMPS